MKISVSPRFLIDFLFFFVTDDCVYSSTLTSGDVLLGNITFFYLCCFRCVTHYVAVNICINCSFFTFIIVIKDSYEVVNVP